MSDTETPTTTDRVCRVCACTDAHACVTLTGPCAWAAKYDDNTGICTACDEQFVPDDALPIHHVDEDHTGRQAGVCSYSGQAPNSLGGCPRGCSGATEHYSNDGHRECFDPAVIR